MDFSQMVLDKNGYIVVRLDGKGFSKLTKEKFEKPFDTHFHTAMVNAVSRLMERLQAVFAFSGSDEVTLLFPPNYELYNRRVEKLLSIPAGEMSALFSMEIGSPASFDSKLFAFSEQCSVFANIRDRAESVAKNAINDALYWYLVKREGYSCRKAHRFTLNLPTSEKAAILRDKGYFADIPTWAFGFCAYWQEYQVEGFNPITQESVMATRRKIVVQDYHSDRLTTILSII